MSINLALSDLLKVSLDVRSTTVEKRTLRALSYQMLPQFVFDAYPDFVEFTETFMDFIEKKYSPDGMPNPGPYHILKNLLDYADIDKTEIEFVKILKFKLGRDLPAVTQHNLRSFLKHIKDFYLSKGTENSIQFFFRSVFNTYSSIYLPKVDLVRASYNTWYVPYITKLRYLGGIDLTESELDGLFDASLYGQTSKQTAWLGLPKDSEHIELLAYSGEFTPGETVTVIKTDGTSLDLWIPTDGIEFLEGTFLTDDGMPSSNKRLQDSFYWQEFSYEVISPNEISDIVNPLVMNVHPAGFKIFARVVDENPRIVDPEDTPGIDIISLLIIHILNEVDGYFGEEGDEIAIINLPTDYSRTSYVQSYVDVGEFFQNEDDDAFALAYPNILLVDKTAMGRMERDEPQFNLMAFFGGRKLISGNDNAEGFKDNGARVFSYADQIASIGFGGVSLETLEEITLEGASSAYIKNISRRKLRSEIFPISQAIVDSNVSSLTLFGDQELDSIFWNQENTIGKKALVFYNGRLVTNGAVSGTTGKTNMPGPYVNLTHVIDDDYGYRIARLSVNTFNPGKSVPTGPGAFEIVFLEARDLAQGTHSETIFISTDSQTSVESSILPDSAEDCLLFRNGLLLTPNRDFNIHKDSIIFRNTSLNKQNDCISIVVLRHYADTGMTVEPMVGDDQLYKIDLPVDAPLQIVNPGLVTNIVNGIWFRLDEESYSVGFPSSFTDVNATNFLTISPLYEAAFVSEETNSIFDSTSVIDFSASDPDLTVDFDLTLFNPVIGNGDDYPYSINMWVKFPAPDPTERTIMWINDLYSTHLGSYSECFLALEIAIPEPGRYDFVLKTEGQNLVLTATNVLPDVWYMITIRFTGNQFDVDVPYILSLDVKNVDTLVSFYTSGTQTVFAPRGIQQTAGLGYDGDPDRKFYGQMAHISFYDKWLRDHEVSALWNNGTGLDKPVRYI